MNLTVLKTSEIVSLYGEVIKELKGRGVIRTNNVIGDLGEYLAVEYYNNTPGLPTLAAAPIGTEILTPSVAKVIVTVSSLQVAMSQACFMG